jgi:hypothetical protein
MYEERYNVYNLMLIHSFIFYDLNKFVKNKQPEFTTIQQV